MWSRPVAGARCAAQTSAASPTTIARPAPAASRSRPSFPRQGLGVEPGEVGRQPLREPGRGATEPVADGRRAAGRQQELGGRQEQSALDRADRALVGRVERAERVDLVAEELDPDRQRQRRREDVDDAAPPRRFAAAGDLGDRHVAEVEQLAQERVLVDPGAEPQLARGDRQVGRGDRVLEERLDAGHHHPRPAGVPRGEGRDAGGRLVGDELAPLVGEGGPRLEDRDRLRVAQPRPELLGHAVADLRVAGDPDQALAAGRQRDGRREVALGPVRHGHQPDVPAGPARVVVRAAESLAQRGERAGRGQQRWQRGQVGQAMAAALAGRRAGRGRGAAGRRRGAVAVEPPPAGARSCVGRRRPRRRPRPRRSRRPRRRSGPHGGPRSRSPRARRSGGRGRGGHGGACQARGITIRRPAWPAGPSASRSASGGSRRRRAGRPPRRRRPGGSCRPAGARTC